MLRPVEWLSATRRGLLLPEDLLEPGAMYVSILAPKTRRVYRRQHVKIDEKVVVAYAEALWGSSPPEARLFELGAGAFRSRWNAIVSAAGFAEGQVRDSVTPACLRGSGATALYRQTSDVRLVQWRGRWSRPQTLEAYIQEAAAAQSLQPLPPEARARILELSEACPALLRRSIAVLRQAALPAPVAHGRAPLREAPRLPG
jgi:hypothetical protein